MADTVMLEYIPIDRAVAMAGGPSPAGSRQGAALFADISGFTPLTEALTRMLGTRRGAEELTLQLNRVYDALTEKVMRFHGSVISFSGDAITCWFDADTSDASARAVASGLAMQAAMSAFTAIRLPNGETIGLAMKVSIASGSARRFLVGDPAVQLMDALAGQTVIRMAVGEHHAERGEVVIDTATAEQLGDRVELSVWREDEESHDRFAIVTSLRTPIEPSPWESVDAQKLGEEQVRPWLLPSVYQRLSGGMGEFLTELRPAVVYFLRFEGIDYEADMDAEQKLDDLIRRVQTIVTRYEGSVLQLTIGDKGSYLYGAFGAPVAHENDPWLAAATALDLQALSQELSYIRPLQIGMSRGSLRTGAYGGATRRTYGVLGDEVNLAARLMQAAPPGEIFVSEVAQRPVASQFAWEPLTPIRVKGKSEPIRLFRLVGHEEPSGLHLREPGYSLPMVGRVAELTLVSEKYDQAVQGRGQLVGVTGEAGMGKSRLLAELIRSIRQRGALIYGGECQSYGTNTSYLVWQPLLQGFFGLRPDQTLNEQITVLERELEAINRTLLPRLPLLGAALGIALPDNDFTRALEPQYRKTSLETMLIECFQFRARQQMERQSALVLVFEDLHWIDPASYDLLELVAQAAFDWSLLMLVAYRPVEQVGHAILRLEALSRFNRIELAQLPDDDMLRFVRLKLEQLGSESVSDTLLQRLLQRAEGNPFYIEELLNYLHDRDLAVAELERIELPSSLQSLILSRIDQLSERQKITLKVASVIGRMFHLARLYGYYPALGEFDQLKADLEHLSDIEITPLDQPEPEVIYLFKHVLTQEVAYESLAYSTRAGLHERFAQYLETGDEQQPLDLIAYHYGRTENVPKKREYFRRAGEAAVRRYANAEAIEYLSRALEVADNQDIAERYTLYLLREQVLHNQALREAQALDIAALEALAERARDDRRRAEVAIRRTKYAKAIGNYPDAVTAAQQAIGWAVASSAAEIEAEGYLEWGETLWFQAQYPDAQSKLEQALGKSGRFPRIEAYTLRTLGRVAMRQGKFADAQAYHDRALPIFRQISDRRGESQVYVDLGSISYFQGLFADARTSFEQALVVFREIGNRWGLCSILNNLGAVAADDTGDYLLAETYLQEALTIARQIGERHTEGNALNNLGFYALARGDYAKAQLYFEQALRLVRVSGDHQEEAILLNNLGVIAASQGDYSAARAYYEQSLTVKREIGDSVGESETLAYRALLAYEQGDDQQAYDDSQRALTIAQEVGAALEESRAANVLGHVLVSLGRLDEAAAMYQQSLEKRREIGQDHLTIEPQAGLARIALAQADLSTALAAIQTILQQLETRSADGLEEPGRVYLTCYQVLQQAQATNGTDVLQAAYHFLETRAAKTATEILRRSFLENVPPHRDLVAAWNTSFS